MACKTIYRVVAMNACISWDNTVLLMSLFNACPFSHTHILNSEYLVLRVAQINIQHRFVSCTPLLASFDDIKLKWGSTRLKLPLASSVNLHEWNYLMRYIAWSVAFTLEKTNYHRVHWYRDTGEEQRCWALHNAFWYFDTAKYTANLDWSKGKEALHEGTCLTFADFSSSGRTSHSLFQS